MHPNMKFTVEYTPYFKNGLADFPGFTFKGTRKQIREWLYGNPDDPKDGGEIGNRNEEVAIRIYRNNTILANGKQEITEILNPNGQ